MATLQTFLSIYYVYLLDLNFFLLVVALSFNYRHIKEILSEIGGK